MDYTAEGFAFALKLSQVRSFFRVGLALSEAFPTEDTFNEYMLDDETIETLNAVAEIMATTISEETAPEEALDRHRDRAVEALEPFAERLGADPDDLLIMLVA